MGAQRTPRVVDNDCDEITVTLDSKEIRGWSYASDAERRTKMLAAREFVEGWHHGVEHAGVPGMLAALRDAYAVLAFAFQRIHALPRSRDTELATDIGKVRARIEATLAKAEVQP